MPKVPKTIDPRKAVPLPKLKDFDRLTYLVNIHHEHRGETPRTVVTGKSLTLKEKEEPYQRRFNATPEWKPLDLGWFSDDPKRVGCVVIENLEGKDLIQNPTEIERQEIETRVLEISYSQKSDEADLVHPGMPDVKWPSDASKLYVRCQSGNASCRITVISR